MSALPHAASSLDLEHTPLAPPVKSVPFLSHEDTPSYRFLAFHAFTGALLTHAASPADIFARTHTLPGLIRVFDTGEGPRGSVAWLAGATLADAELSFTEVNDIRPAVVFQIRGLSVLMYANGFTHWHYNNKTGIPADLLRESFFADAADMMRTGDMIAASHEDGAVLLTVTGISAGRVNVRRMA